MPSGPYTAFSGRVGAVGVAWPSAVVTLGMTIELSKLEPPEYRGYILTTGQLVRFASTTVTNMFHGPLQQSKEPGYGPFRA